MIKEPKELFLPYPSWRDGQFQAIEWLEENDWLRDKEAKRVKVLEAPPGSGKTGLILGLAANNPDLRFLILCATKLEQQQYENNVTDESNFISIKGRNNFHCMLKHSETVGNWEECQQKECGLTHVNVAPCSVDDGTEFPCKLGCFYYSQLPKAREMKAVCSNYVYGLIMLNYLPTALGKFDVIVEDEGHTLDAMLENFISLKFNKRQFERLFNLPLPTMMDKVRDWKEWISENWDELRAATFQYNLAPEDMSRKELEDFSATEEYLSNLAKMKLTKTRWVVDEDSTKYEVRPTWVTKDSEDALFRYAPKHIIMSGTIPSERELAKKIGLGLDKIDFLRLSNTFPPENRLIEFYPVVDLTYGNKEGNLGLLAKAVDRILADNLNIKGLIHTKSYDIVDSLLTNSEYARYFFTHNTHNRMEMLERFKMAEAPAFLVSPSMDKAVDLPGNECELIIICKIPFLYLGTRVMKKRVKESSTYYTHETLMVLIQMAGRGVRSEQDVCVTKVLDSKGPEFLSRASRMIPQSIQDAIRIYEETDLWDDD